jgi:hypothetical protein
MSHLPHASHKPPRRTLTGPAAAAAASLTLPEPSSSPAPAETAAPSPPSAATTAMVAAANARLACLTSLKLLGPVMSYDQLKQLTGKMPNLRHLSISDSSRIFLYPLPLTLTSLSISLPRLDVGERHVH